MKARWILLLGWCMTSGSRFLQAETIPVPNYSFESPVATLFGGVTINVDSWEKAAKPDWYDEGGDFSWDQLIGQFKNTTPGSHNHIDNCESNQAIWLFAVPEVALFQDYDTVDWNDPSPTHAFDATFVPNQAYTLTASVLGGGGGMLEGATLEMALYFRDNASNQIVVASTVVTNTLANFPTNTHFYDYEVKLPPVKTADAWAEKNIGIRFRSTVSDAMKRGYWDLDNIRLHSQSAPILTGFVSTNGQFTLTVQSEPGLIFEILTTTLLASPLTNWTSLGQVTNTVGTTPFIDPINDPTHFPSRFYRVRSWP